MYTFFDTGALRVLWPVRLPPAFKSIPISVDWCCDVVEVLLLLGAVVASPATNRSPCVLSKMAFIQ